MQRKLFKVLEDYSITDFKKFYHCNVCLRLSNASVHTSRSRTCSTN